MAAKPVKNKNLGLIVDALRLHGTQCQSQLAQHTGLQASTISNHTRLLRQAEILTAAGKGSTGPEGGRPSDILDLNMGKNAVGVLQIRGRDIMSALLDARGQVLQRKTQPLPPGAERDLPRHLINEINFWRTQHSGYAGTALLVSSQVNSQGDILARGSFPWSWPGLVPALRQQLPPEELIELHSCATALGWLAHIRDGRLGGLRTSFYAEREPFALSASILNDELVETGHHHRGGLLWKGTEHTPYPLAGSPHAIKLFLTWLQDQLLTTSLFMDARSLILGGDFLLTDSAILDPFLQSLTNSAQPCVVQLLPEKDAVLTGGAFLLLDNIYEEKLQKQEYGDI